MIYAHKGNKLLRISEDETQKFLANGFDIVDESGTVLKETVPTDVEKLKAGFADQQNTIALLKEENAKLKAEIESLKSDKPEQPKKTRTSKTASTANEN